MKSRITRAGAEVVEVTAGSVMRAELGGLGATSPPPPPPPPNSPPLPRG